MSQKIKLCQISDVGVGQMLRVDNAGLPPLVVYNVGGSFYVTSNVCTHNVAFLTDGYLTDDIVECPLHGGCFNVKTGAATEFPCETPLQTYVTTVEGDALYIEA